MLHSLPLTAEIAAAFATFPYQDASHRPRRPCRPYVSECEFEVKWLTINKRTGDWLISHQRVYRKGCYNFQSPPFIWYGNENGPVDMRELVRTPGSKDALREMERLKASDHFARTRAGELKRIHWTSPWWQGWAGHWCLR